VYQHFGSWGLLVIALVALWWQWDHIRDLPEVHEAVCVYDMSDWTLKWGLPEADPNRFAVGVAHLEYDEGHSFEDFLDEALGNFDRGTGIQPLRFDRTICLRGQPEEAEKKGHEKAQKYLKKLARKCSFGVWSEEKRPCAYTGHRRWAAKNLNQRINQKISSSLPFSERI
jgi:hypothetical protein